MLNIFKLKLKKSYKLDKLEFFKGIKKPMKFQPITRNWKNSIYVYNKNTLSNIPEATRLINKLIKDYFYSFKIKNLKKIRRYIKIKKNLRHRILLSDGEYKHTNDLLDITIYFHNRQLSSYKSLYSKRLIFILKKYVFKKKLLWLKRLNLKYLIYKKGLEKLLISKKGLEKFLLNGKLEKILFYQKNNKKYLKKFAKRSLRKTIALMHLKKLMFINEYKFNTYYLQNLINIVKKIYKKDIRFNFIKIKGIYMNSDILTQDLVTRIRKNRRRLNYYLRKTLLRAKIKKLKNPIDWSENDLRGIVLKKVDYKEVTGIRIQASGRLTRRFTASRSISKLKYKGNLVNLNSSLEGEHSSLLRGNFKPNLEFTKLNSKTRIGSFGIKGWVSGQ
jgi:hypothetical protein